MAIRYVVGCSYYCSAYFDNPSAYKVTNNTGWVKLVSTPVVGTVWTVMEDALDHFVSDRVQGDRIHAKFPKILRGWLNPAHTMANFTSLAGALVSGLARWAQRVFDAAATSFLPGTTK